MAEKLLKDLIDAIIKLDIEKATNLTKSMIDKGITAREIILDGIMPGMKAVGEMYERKDYFLSDLLFGAYLSEECFKLLEPLLAKEIKEVPIKGKLVIATVKGDIHDIGKKIFTSLMRAEGFEIYDLGVDISAETIAEKVKEIEAEVLIVGTSALLSTTAPYFKDVHEALEKAGVRDKVLFMTGGPPIVTADEVNADFYTNNAFVGVKRALEYVNKKKQ